MYVIVCCLDARAAVFSLIKISSVVFVDANEEKSSHGVSPQNNEQKDVEGCRRQRLGWLITEMKTTAVGAGC